MKMPEVMRIGQWIFFIWSEENQDINEPPHVHVRHKGNPGKTAKFWLQPVELAGSKRMNPRELSKVTKLVR
jgi:hypothetical protein